MMQAVSPAVQLKQSYRYVKYTFFRLDAEWRRLPDDRRLASKDEFLGELKKYEWYSIPFEERRRIMKDHVQIGHKFSSVTIHTAYSFGLDDYEFVLSFETDRPEDFLNLVMELRSSEASKYTAIETPIFTCKSVTPEEMLNLLGS